MYISYQLIRVSAATPNVTVADPHSNVEHIAVCLKDVARFEPDLVVFPELCLTGYTCADLFLQTSLLVSAEAALARLLDVTAGCQTVLAVGLPLAVSGQLFNCAAVIQGGSILGVVPKSIIPNYREFYERRWFTPAASNRQLELSLCGQTSPFGTNLIFRAENQPNFSFAVEICEDLWAPIPPSTRLALGGATVLLNLSASHELVGKSDYRQQLVLQQSGRCLAAYAYSSAGPQESTTDLVFGGHCMIAENNTMLQQSPRLQRSMHNIVADIDVEYLTRERLQNHAFNSQIEMAVEGLRYIEFTPEIRTSQPAALQRSVHPLPFILPDPDRRKQRCQEIIAIQSHGLATRMQGAKLENAVLGLSGGLDSTLALLVTIEAFKHLQLPPCNIHCFTLPGFGTSKRTLQNVVDLCMELKVDLQQIDIRAACRQHFQDLNHDGSTADVAFENIQARERSQILMNKANMLNGLAIGTSDLSELALGWCTYGGDHLSMYHVNAGVPKTLISYLIGYFAETYGGVIENNRLSKVLMDILDTPISPELLPLEQDESVNQQTEKIIGPYRLNDFFLYYLIHRGLKASKVLYFAEQAFNKEYKKREIRRCLEQFIKRFFSQQFKRSCMPDGPKVGTIALSPRADWRMPSDITGRAWLTDLAEKDINREKPET